MSIVVKDLHFSYGSTEILHGLTFSVPSGQVTGLLGPNGAGKSTTLRMLIGLLQPSAGTVEVAGWTLPSQSFDVKQIVGYVPEAATLYETLTAQEFLELCGGLHDVDETLLRRRIDAFLEVFDLSDSRHQRLGAYSKGMRQKVMLASALLHDPSVVILDEPLTGLDTDSAALIKNLLTSLAAEGKTVLYSSHVLEVVERVCASVLILHNGVVMAAGAPEDLMAQANARSLEEVFRRVTRAVDLQPRVDRMLDELRR